MAHFIYVPAIFILGMAVEYVMRDKEIAAYNVLIAALHAEIQRLKAKI